MFTNNFNNTFRKLNEIELASRKDVLAVVDSRFIADELKQNIIDFAESFDHVRSGRMVNSIGVRNMGDGEYGVTAVDYAKFVNGRDRDNFGGNGFIDDAVDQTMLEYDLDPGDIEIRYEQ